MKLKRNSFLWIAAILILLSAGIIAVTPLGKQAGYLRHQSRISHQVLPANTVIYTEDIKRINSLRGQIDYKEKKKYPDYPTNAPAAWERKGIQGSLESYWENTNGDISGLAIDDTFSWPCTSKSGFHWVINLGQVNPWNAPKSQRKIGLTQSAYRPAGWKSGERAIVVSFMSDQILLQSTDSITIFAPQPDRNDTSRVNVPYELNGQSGVIDAVVTDKGLVQFNVRSGPAHMVKWNSL